MKKNNAVICMLISWTGFLIDASLITIHSKTVK